MWYSYPLAQLIHLLYSYVFHKFYTWPTETATIILHLFSKLKLYLYLNFTFTIFSILIILYGYYIKILESVFCFQCFNSKYYITFFNFFEIETVRFQYFILTENFCMRISLVFTGRRAECKLQMLKLGDLKWTFGFELLQWPTLLDNMMLITWHHKSCSLYTAIVCTVINFLFIDWHTTTL